jgi:hypothetical protein
VSCREQQTSSLFALLPRGYDLDMNSDFPAVVTPRPVEAHAPEAETALTRQEAPQEASEPRWLALATPLVPGAAHGLSRAVLEMLEGMGAMLPTIEDLARATVEAACGIAADASLPPAVRVAAVHEARQVVEVVVGVERDRAASQPNWGARLLQVIGLAAIIGAAAAIFRGTSPPQPAGG